MRMHFVASCLLLVLTALCVIQTAVDGATFRIPIRHQWRAPAHGQGGTTRASERHTIAITGEWPEISIPPLGHRAVQVPRRDVPWLFAATIFVPPRL